MIKLTKILPIEPHAQHPVTAVYAVAGSHAPSRMLIEAELKLGLGKGRASATLELGACTRATPEAALDGLADWLETLAKTLRTREKPVFTLPVWLDQ